MALEYKLISSIDLWMTFHQARNETSHTYNKNTATEVFEVVQGFLPEVNNLYQQLLLKND